MNYFYQLLYLRKDMNSVDYGCMLRKSSIREGLNQILVRDIQFYLIVRDSIVLWVQFFYFYIWFCIIVLELIGKKYKYEIKGRWYEWNVFVFFYSIYGGFFLILGIQFFY